MDTDPNNTGSPPTQDPADSNAALHVRRPILEVIRDKCIDCSGGSRAEVARCTAVRCALWPYRSGHSPWAKPRGPGKRNPANLAQFRAGNGLPDKMEGGR
jgi:hypothetical protein